LGCFPNEQKMALYYKDTARTVTLALNLVSTFHAFDQFYQKEEKQVLRR